jgi:uncharacterized membrane protein
MKLTSHDKKLIVQAITEAEQKTTGEIRVHVTYSAHDETPLDQAKKVFHSLKMNETQARNGVLIYFNPKARKFALYGDQGIHEKLGQKYWEELVQKVRSTIHEKSLIDGILGSVQELGNQLATHFPGSHDDQNELHNDVSESE